MSKDKSGKSLEKAVARIQQMLDPGSVVTHNEYIVDCIGNRRQFDVVIRGTLSLLPDDPIDAGFSIGVVGYAKEYQWGKYEFSMRCQAQGCSEVLAITDINSILLDGKPVYDWYAKQLSTTYSCATGPEPTRIEVRFKNVTSFQIQGRTYGVIQMAMTAYREWKINADTFKLEEMLFTTGKLRNFHGPSEEPCS